MHRIVQRFVYRGVLAGALCFAPVAEAGLFRAYLSVGGNDANPCTVAQPCRLLPAALSAVNDGGEIWLLDSANFNTSTVNISKSVSIVGAPGELGSLVANGGAAVVINAPGASVTLRNLNLRPLNAAATLHGIDVTSVGQLYLENVTIDTMSVGLNLTGPATIGIRNSVIRSSGTGLNIAQSNVETISIDSTSFLQNTIAINALTNSTTGSLRISMDNSVVTGGGCCNGALAFGGGVANAAPLQVAIRRTKIVGNGSGLALGSFGSQTVVSLGECHISGWSIAGEVLNGPSGVGHLETLGNNMIVQNASGLFGATSVAPQ